MNTKFLSPVDNLPVKSAPDLDVSEDSIIEPDLQDSAIVSKESDSASPIPMARQDPLWQGKAPATRRHQKVHSGEKIHIHAINVVRFVPKELLE